MNLIPDTILRAVCWTLLHSLWHGLIFAVVAGIVMVLTKRASSAMRYNLLCCLMILFLAVSGTTFYRQLGADEAPGSAATIGQVAAANASGGPALHASGKDAAATALQNGAHTLRNIIESLAGYFNSHAALVVVIWFILFLARFVRMLSGLVYAQRIRHYQTSPAPADWQRRLAQLLDKLQIRRPVSLLESALVKVPVVVGALKPVILVPLGMLAHLTAEQVESILLHELAHIRRRDYLFNLVQHLIDTLFFFNPALIWVSSLIRSERENCCDDIAIRETRNRRQLIEALVSFHEYRQSTAGLTMAFAGSNENQVVRRVKRIVHKTNHSLNPGERLLLMGGVMVLCAAFITINGSRVATTNMKKPQVTQPKVTQPTSTVQPVSATRPASTTKSAPATQSAKMTTRAASMGTTRNPQPVQQPTVLPPTPLIKDTVIKGTSDSSGEGITYMGYKNISLDKLIECKEHGVTAEFIQSFRK